MRDKMKLVLILCFATLTGCAHFNTVEWSCEGVPSVEGLPTETVVKCGNKVVTFKHLERKTPWCPKKAEVKP